MHAYATNATDRITVPIKLGVCGVGLSYILYLFFRWTGIASPWWLDVPGPVAISALLIGFYDRRAWRWSIGPLRLSRIPYLGGTWAGELRSSYEADPGPHLGELHIVQKWSSILIRFEPSSGQSRSHSTMAAINTEDSAEPCLSYEYVSDPRALASETMASHRGVARLDFSRGDLLTGDYYTGRGRGTRGEMEFRRQPTRSRHHFSD